ncbi:hypothetical protein ABEF93_007957 [Exophiala dermatitidis]
MDRFENKFLFRMLFAVFGLAIIGISGPLTAVLLRKQTHVHPYKDTSLPSSQATVQQASESTSLKSK